jgi:hypothetical protein
VRQLTLLLPLMLAATAQAAEPPAGGPVILDARGPWRCFSVRGSELARKADGKLQHLYEFEAARSVKVEGKRRLQLFEVDAPTHTPLPPEDWTSPEFDDGDWARAGGPFYAFSENKYGFSGVYLSVPLICLRARFRVDDPGRVKGLELSLTFEGGAVVYVNGKELERAHLPEGKLQPLTPAEDYSVDAFVGPDKYLLRHKYGDPKKHPDRYKLRARKIDGLAVPASALRRGVNVLCVELHRAPAPEAMFTGRTRSVSPRAGAWWNRVGLIGAKLTGAGVAPVSGAPRGAGLRVRAHPVVDRVSAADRGDPNEPRRPLRITGTRNGVFSAQLAASDTKPIANMKVIAGELKGPGVIPASAVQVRYMLRDGYDSRAKKHWFYGLEEIPPGEVAVIDEAGAAVRPVWVTVKIPPDTAPGDYRGTVTVSADGAKPVELPLELRVAGWKMPDSRDFGTHVGLIQSPETLAMQYKVPLWSEEHWKLVERSFELLGQVGNKVIYVTMVRRTHFGNEHGMVIWERAADGSLKPDLSIAERYVAAAVKHMGKVPMVGVYCWEPLSSPAHYPSHLRDKSLGDREIMISVRDAKTGKLEEAKGPKWGTPECRAFWKPAMDGLRAILKRHGIEKSMMVGVACDYTPTKECLADLAAVAPDAPWINHSHVYRDQIGGRPVGYLAAVWGLHGTRDPALPPTRYSRKHYYGWRNPFLAVAFPRTGSPVYEITRGKPPLLHRFLAEGALVSAGRPNAKTTGVRGFGRFGADFWPALTAARSGRGIGRGQAAPLCGRYPEALGGGMALTYVKYHILSPGRDGAIGTDLLEMLREGLQEAEARIFIEKALLDPAARAKLGDELAAECQTVLDERVRTFMRAAGKRNLTGPDWLWFRGTGWQQRSWQLYSAAARTAARLEKN